MKLFYSLRDGGMKALFYLATSMAFYSIVVNTPLLILANSEKLQKIIPLNTWLLLAVMVPVLITGGIIFGIFLDKVIGYNRIMAKTVTERNPQIIEILERVKSIEERVKNNGS